jgi:hypothetical protein
MEIQENLDLAGLKSFQGCLFHTGMQKRKLEMDDDERPQQVVEIPKDNGLGTHP